MAKIAEVQEVSLDLLRPYSRNAKVHGSAQIEKLKNSIKEFGFLTPCLIDRDYNLIAGHGRVQAAKEMGLASVPCVFIEGLSEEQRKAYVLADNRLGELGTWDDELLDSELKELYAAGFDINLTGFELDLGELKTEEGEEGTSVNPTASLPESRIFVIAVSAFGTNAERFIEAKLTQEEADHLLSRFGQVQATDVVARLKEALDAV